MALNNFNLTLIKRTAKRKGPTSSEAWNDSFSEIIRDLANLYTEWNTKLVPLTSLLPDGTNDLDAFTDGLDGRTLLVNSEATAASEATYFNVAANRPNTVSEQLKALYLALDAATEGLQNDLDSFTVTAAGVIVVDTANLYAASNVEAALSEVMTKLNSTTSDHGALGGLGDDDHPIYIPADGSRGMTGNFQIEGQSYSLYDSTVLAPSGTTQAIDWNNGNSQVLDLESASGDVTLTFANAKTGASYILEVRQDSATPRDINWPADVTWPSASVPIISVAANAVDIFTLWYNGTNYRAVAIQAFA